MKTATENMLNFVPVQGQTDVYISEPYKIVRYDWSRVNGCLVEKPCWIAYHRVYDRHTKKMLFGDAVEKTGLYESKSYLTKEEAIAACYRHLQNK